MSLYKGVVFLIAYFIIVSLVIGTVVYEKENERISGITIQSEDVIANQLNFSAVDILNLIDMGLLSHWEISGSNLVFTGSGLFNVLPQSDVMFKNIIDDNGVYRVSYTLNRGSTQEFELWVRASGISSYSIRYKDGYLYSPRRNVVTGMERGYLDDPYWVISYPVSEATLTTEYNRNADTIRVLDGGVELGNWSGDYPYSGGGIVVNHYGGIGAWGDAGLVLSEVQARIILVEGSEDEEVDFWKLMLTLLAWNVDEEYMPWWANILFIKLPGLFVVVALAMYLRGVS